MNDSHLIPLNWISTTFGEVIENSIEQRKPLGEGLFVYVDISSIDNKTKKIIEPKRIPFADAPSRAKQVIKPNDVLVSMTRPNLNAVAILPESLVGAIGSTGFCVLRAIEVEPRWIFYITQTNAFVDTMSRLVQGALYPAIRPKDIFSYKIPLAPFAEQHRIVEEIEKQFTRLDAAVVALKRVQANLTRYRASVLKAACEGKLVPTEAELARAEGYDYEHADKLLERILKQRRAKWESDQFSKIKTQGKTSKVDKWKEKYQAPAEPDTTNLPKLPEGWTWAKWEQVGFSQNGQSFPSKEYQESGVKLLRPGNLHASGKVIWTKGNTRYMSEKWATENPRFIIGSRELVINLTAQSLKDEFLGRVCITNDSERCLLNQRIARLTPLEILPEYLLWMFKSKIFRRFVDGLNMGSLIQHMFTSQLADFCLPLPPLAEQQRIVAEVERRLSVVDEIESVVKANLKRAAVLRQSILKNAFEGKLVMQDPLDEPASVLLERIRSERASSTTETKPAKPTRPKRKVQQAQQPRLPLVGKTTATEGD